MSRTRWLNIEGLHNIRDMGGLRTTDGRVVQPRRLFRSENLQEITPAGVRELVAHHNLRTVVDLRHAHEVTATGPSLVDAEPAVRVVRSAIGAEPVQDQSTQTAEQPVAVDFHRQLAQSYLGYLQRHSELLISTLRSVASSPGATLVHCASGKDRTGVLTALALNVAGVSRDTVLEDYVMTAERIEAVVEGHRASPAYGENIAHIPLDHFVPRAYTMEIFLDRVEDNYGGLSGWLELGGWSAEDAEALRHKLIDPG